MAVMLMLGNTIFAENTKVDAPAANTEQVKADPIDQISLGFINKRDIEGRGVRTIASNKFPGKVNLVFYGGDKSLFLNAQRAARESIYYEETPIGGVYLAKETDMKYIEYAGGGDSRAYNPDTGEASGVGVHFNGQQINEFLLHDKEEIITWIGHANELRLDNLKEVAEK